MKSATSEKDRSSAKNVSKRESWPKDQTDILADRWNDLFPDPKYFRNYPIRIIQ